MDVSQDNPIIIYSDDEDDDDVVLIKEEKAAANADKQQEDDVIFISANPPPSLQKCLSEDQWNKHNRGLKPLSCAEGDIDDCTIPHVRYFQSAFSSLSLVDDILRPLGVPHPLVLTTEILPSVIKSNVAHLKLSQFPCGSISIPEQGQSTHGKSGDDIEISSVKSLNDVHLNSAKNVIDSVLASTPDRIEKLPPLKLLEVGGITSLSSQVLDTPLSNADKGAVCFNLYLAERNKVTTAARYVLDTSSTSRLTCTETPGSLNVKQSTRANITGKNDSHEIQSLTTSANANSPCANNVVGFATDVHTSLNVSSDELAKAVDSIMDPLLNQTHNVDSDKSEDAVPVSLTYRSEIDPNPGASKPNSSLINSHGLEPTINSLKLCVSDKTKLPINSNSSLSFNLNNLSAEDIVNLFDFIPDNDKAHMQNEPGIGDSCLSESDHTHIESKVMPKLVTSSNINQTLVVSNPKESTTSDTLLILTNVSQDDCSVTKSYQTPNNVDCITSEMSTISQRENQLSAVRNGSHLTDSDKSSDLHCKCSSSVHAPFDLEVKDFPSRIHRSKEWIIRHHLEQRKKCRQNHYKSDSLMRAQSKSADLRSVLDSSDVKVGYADALAWQIVSSDFTRKKSRVQTDSQIDHFSDIKRRKLVEDSLSDNPSLKVTLKLFPSTSDSTISHHHLPCKLGMKKSIIRRHADLVDQQSASGSPPNVSMHHSVSEIDLKESAIEKKYFQMCVTCDQTVSNEKLSKCDKGHGICATCLQSQVKIILTGDVKQKHIKCASRSCTEVLTFDELKRTLPFFVVEILEAKLDREYINYITKWMFTDEQLKSRSEFATLDTGTNSCSAMNMVKYDTQESRGPTEDFPTFWTPMERGSHAMAFEVVADTEEYRALACQFYETLSFGDYDIVKIIRIQNPVLWKYFALKQSEMLQENAGVNVVEKQLYHGTHRSTLEAIARKGFDWRLSGKHGTVFGCGSYFARTAHYSHAYTDRGGSGVSVKSSSGLGYMFQTSTCHSSLSMGHSLVSAIQHWYQAPQPSAAHCQIAVPPPAHGQMPAHNQKSNQVPVNTTTGVTAGTSSNLSSVRIFPKTSTSSSTPTGSEPPIFNNFNTYLGFSNTSSSSSLYNNHFLPNIYASSSSSSKNIGNLLAANIPSYLGDSLRYSNCSSQSKPMKGSSTISDAKGLAENKPETSSTPLVLQNYEKGTADLTSTLGRDQSSKTHFMFVARVLVGRHTVGKSGLKRPPPLDDSNPYGKCYDSCVDDISSPQVFVIFDSNQAYPEYIIEYNWHKG